MKSWRSYNWDAAWQESLFPVINVSPEETKLVTDFSKNQTDNYGARGQSNEKDKIKQKSWGKMGELVTWDVDISSSKHRFLVKSCGSSSVCRNECSWVLQFADDNGSGVDKEIFVYKPNDGNKVFSFVLVDFDNRIGRVACFCHLLVIRRYGLHLGMPIKDSLKWSKRIVYYRELVKQLALDNSDIRTRII